MGTISEWRKILPGLVVTLVLVIGTQTPAKAESRTIRFGNWVPMHHLMVQGIFIPWTQAIERESGGTLKFEIMIEKFNRTGNS